MAAGALGGGGAGAAGGSGAGGAGAGGAGAGGAGAGAGGAGAGAGGAGAGGAELAAEDEEEELLELEAPVVLPDVALLPEAELDPEFEAALPPLVVADELEPLPPVEEVPLTRAGLAKVAVELLYPEPPHPAIAAIRKKENKTALSRIRASAYCDWRSTAANPINGNYGRIYSGPIRGSP